MKTFFYNDQSCCDEAEKLWKDYIKVVEKVFKSLTEEQKENVNQIIIRYYIKGDSVYMDNIARLDVLRSEQQSEEYVFKPELLPFMENPKEIGNKDKVEEEFMALLKKMNANKHIGVFDWYDKRKSDLDLPITLYIGEKHKLILCA